MFQYSVYKELNIIIFNISIYGVLQNKSNMFTMI